VGDTKTCYITNSDIQPQLTVIKHVITNDSGTAVASDWQMDVTAINPDSAAFPGAEDPGTTIGVDAGAYSVDESGGPAGYAKTLSADCSGTIAVGESKTCTITNDDIAPTLTVIKVLVPDTDTGTFTLKINEDHTTVAYLDDATDGSTLGPVDLTAGVLYTVGEAGYGDTDLSQYVVIIGGDCAADGSITLDLAQDATCTIANIKPSNLTDTSYCSLPDQQFKLLYHIEVAPNIYRMQSSNPGQFYYNAIYQGVPGDTVTLEIEIPYPFVTQEGAGVPIQVHDWLSVNNSNCLSPSADISSSYTIITEALTPKSSAGNQIITPDDYSTKNMGASTTVTVSGTIPDTGILYVTIHLDYGLKKTGDWKPTGTTTTNPVTDLAISDVQNKGGFGSGAVTIRGYELYDFSYTDGINTYESTYSSINEFKKFAGFMGFVTKIIDSVGNEEAIVGAAVEIRSPSGLHRRRRLLPVPLQA
jgi:hypothetical protein